MATAQDLQIIKKALSDLFFFSKFILGYNLLQENPHREMADFIMRPGKIKIQLEPRDCFKTTLGTISNAIWRSLRDYNIRILINHKVLKKAQDILREIKTHFEINRRLIYFFGNLIGDVWTQDEIIINKRTEILKEPTIAIGAVDHEAVSGHYDYIINDDLAGLKDMYSEKVRARTKQYYISQTYLRDTKKFEGEHNIGTRWHPEDVYNLQLKKKHCLSRIKSIILPSGKLYFPDRHDMESIKEKKEDDPVLFESQMMNNPRALRGCPFPLDTLLFYKEKAFRGDYQIAYIDPAFGMQSSSEPCFFVLIVATLIDDDLYIRDWPANQDGAAQNEILVCEKIIEWKIQELYIESNAAQTEFIRNIERALSDRNIFLTISPVNNTANKDRRIQGIHGTVKKKVYFRDDWEIVYPISMAQLTLYPHAKFKDAPDSLAGVIKAARESAIPNVRNL